MGRALAMTVKVLGVGSVSDESIGMLADSFEDAAAEVDELELLDFLAADLDPVPADPAFRERLGDMLWDMVRDGRVGRPRNH